MRHNSYRETSQSTFIPGTMTLKFVHLYKCFKNHITMLFFVVFAFTRSCLFILHLNEDLLGNSPGKSNRSVHVYCSKQWCFFKINYIFENDFSKRNNKHKQSPESYYFLTQLLQKVFRESQLNWTNKEKKNGGQAFWSGSILTHCPSLINYCIYAPL